MIINVNQAWQSTGVSALAGQTITITINNWDNVKVNPNQPAHDNEGFGAGRVGYLDPFKKEGCLIVRSGLVSATLQTSLVFVAVASGMIEVAINDDTNSLYGAGYSDNEGSIDITISVS